MVVQFAVFALAAAFEFGDFFRLLLDRLHPLFDGFFPLMNAALLCADFLAEFFLFALHLLVELDALLLEAGVGLLDDRSGFAFGVRFDLCGFAFSRAQKAPAQHSPYGQSDN